MQQRWCSFSRKNKMFFLVLGIVLINFLTEFVSAESTAVVNTTSGPVQGEILTTVLKSVKYATFKGIPYAKPPLGYLRFKPPVPIDPWTETLDATTEGDECAQVDLGTKLFSGSEDCLFLNVFTPVTNLSVTPTKLKAVMVWIYGGGFVVGSASTEDTRPDFLLEKDVVFVAMNYRVGPLGFLGLNHPNATGNAGLKDQKLALKWVQANIERFGGNPNNVTIFGQSAGSASVGYHVISDASAGLFHGAISMSGVPLNPWAFQTPENAQSQAKRLGAAIGVTSVDKEVLLKAFYEASASELCQAAMSLTIAYPIFVPTLEDKNIATDVFLSKCSVSKYITGNYSHVPHIMGFMEQELLGITDAIINLLSAPNATNQFGINLPNDLAEIKNQVDSSPNFMSDLNDIASKAITNITSDLLFVAQIDQTQKLLAATNNKKPIFYYHNTFFTDRNFHNLMENNTLLGAAHADDVAYIFYIPCANYSINDPTDPVTLTINRVSTMWTNLAKYGNPTPNWVDDVSVNITWPDSGPSGRALNIGTELTVESRPTDAFTNLVEFLSWPELPKTNGCL